MRDNKILISSAAMLFILSTYACSQGQQTAVTETEEPAVTRTSAPDAVETGGAAAVVNGKPVPMFELRTAVRSVVMQNGMDPENVDVFMGQFGPRILKQLIEGELLYQEAEKDGFIASDEDVDKAFNEIIGRYGDEEEFREQLEARGYTEETLKNSLRRQITIQKFIRESILPEAVVPEEAVRQAYDENPQNFEKPEEVQASHILIKSAEDDTQEQKDEALRRAEEIAVKAREQGSDFASLAREYSEGPSGPSGGDLGSFTRGRMVKPFEDAAFSMKIGEVSDPVLTRFGYHVIKVIDRKEGEKLSFDEVKGRLQQDLVNRMVNEMINRKLAELREEAEIEILFEPDDQEAQ